MNKNLDQLPEDELLTKAKMGYQSIKNDRQKLDYNFYVWDAYYRGNHFAQWNKFTKSLQTPPAKKGEVRIPIPISKDIIQRTLLEVLKDKPEWDVLPADSSDEETKSANQNNLLLDTLFYKLRAKKKLKQAVLHGLKFSVGIWEVFWNKESEEGKGEVDIRVVDPSDFYIGLNFENPVDAPLISKTVRKDLGYLRNSNIYKELRHKWLLELKPDNEVTDNSWRQQVLTNQNGGSEGTPGADAQERTGTVLLQETYIKYYPNGETIPKWKLITWPVKQEGLIMRVDTVDRLPFYAYHSDQNPGEFYGEGWLKHLVPLNRAIDIVENKSLEFHHKFVKGQYIMDRGAGVKHVTNESGQMIEVNPGRRFDAVPVPQLPVSTRDQINAFHTYAQDTGGIHDASLGRPAKGLEGARAIEGAMQGDHQAKSDLLDNVQDFLEDVGRHVLWLVSQNYTTSRQVKMYSQDGAQQFKALGDASTNQNKDQMTNTLVVKPNNDVHVTVGSSLGNTQEARQQKAIELFQMGLLPKEYVLKVFGVSNISDLVEKAQEQALKAIEAQRDKPPEKDTKDYVNTKLSDLGPTERAQYLKKIGIEPEQDPHMVPNSPLGNPLQAHAQNAAMADQNTQKMLTDLQSQQQASLDPTIEGGLNDPIGQMKLQQEMENQQNASAQQPA